MASLTWYKIASSFAEIDWQQNRMAIIEVNGKKITLAQFNSDCFAFAYKCPHAGGIMANGFLDAVGNVVCPLHRYKFSIDKGRNVTGEGYYLKTYPIENRVDGIYVGLASNSFLDFLK